MLDRAWRNDIDLVVMSRKPLEKSSGKLSEKLTRKAPCSVLMIPEGNESKITKVAVAVDFSEHSADAMDVGIAFASAASIAEIVCLHVYNVPSGYYKTGKCYEQFAEVMKKNAEQNYQEFIS